jgi:DNA primase
MATPVEQIKERLSILEVIGGYVELKHAGKSYKGKSPFTNEKTPSFYVSPDRGMYFCFSSQKGGDIFTFIQEMEGVDFKGALKILAERANVELVAEDPHVRDERDMQYALLEAATEYFFRERDAYPHVGEYIGARGVKAATIHTWRIGYAKDEWRALKLHLAAKGFTEEQMFKAGLIKRADAGKDPYDVFRDRIMFPIMDTSGRVVAFSGRTLKTESGIPKYVNSPETELFQKSEILYGYDKAKHGIRHYDFSLVVEGQFDLVLAHQAGYSNTVAVSGTALTSYHIMLLLRLSKNVVLALDADRAGISAVKRVALPMLQHGMDVKVAHMPEGKDPADIIRNDPSEFKHIVGNAVHVVEFLLTILKLHAKDDRTYKLRVREEIIPLLIAMDNRIDREHFEGVIAERIGATKEGIHFEVERHAETAKQSGVQQTPATMSVVHNENRLPAKVTNRKHSLEYRLSALLTALVDERSWIKEQIMTHLTSILTESELQEFIQLQQNSAHQGEVFILEEQIEKTHEKQFHEEVGDTLTQFAHLVARERMAQVRILLKQAEGEKRDADIPEILATSKTVESLLQAKFVIGREV